MRIGLNALYMIPGGVGGTERYARKLIENLARVAPSHDVIVFSNREAADTWGTLPTNVEVRACSVDARSRPQRIAYEQVRLPLLARSAKLDVLHSLGYTAPLAGSRIARCPSVVTLHDLNYHFHPEDWERMGLAANRLLIPRVARAVTRVLTISHASEHAIHEVLGIPSADIDVVYHGVDGNLVALTAAEQAQHLASLELTPGYFLSVTASHPHKNLATLFAAYDRVCRRWPDAPPLVVVGIPGRDHERVKAEAASRRVILTGWVDDAVLSALYRGAGAFVFTSRYEGFGFPVLEAMSVGVPVISSNAASLAELIEGAATSVSPNDADGFATGMLEAVRSQAMRHALIDRGKARAAAFTWAKCARETLEVYERAIATWRS